MNFRKISTILLGVSFLGLSATGGFLSILGRSLNIFGTPIIEWHTRSAKIFIFFALVHIYLKRKIIIGLFIRSSKNEV